MYRETRLVDPAEIVGYNAPIGIEPLCKEIDMQDLRSYLAAGHILLADGATGTVLQSMGLEPGAAPELWNVEKPDSVRALHRAYLEAGAQVVLTNSFGGSRLKLERTGGLGDRVVELNQSAARLARAEVGAAAYVAGDIGPSGELMVPYGTLDYAKAVAVFAEQARLWSMAAWI